MEFRKIHADVEVGYNIGLNSAACKSVSVKHMGASAVICPEHLFRRIQAMIQTGILFLFAHCIMNQ
jgi:hypothetical protein